MAGYDVPTLPTLSTQPGCGRPQSGGVWGCVDPIGVVSAPLWSQWGHIGPRRDVFPLGTSRNHWGHPGPNGDILVPLWSHWGHTGPTGVGLISLGLYRPHCGPIGVILVPLGLD